MTSKHLVFHGHFYQPPRENPWSGAVERESSATPYHDWNERITAECYGPCAATPFSARGKDQEILNLYSLISFNFGPTLLNWLECRYRRLYMAILQADRDSAKERGHGNALAQVYNHIIMPLASLRDKRTQVKWGLQDFRQRFAREAEGLWLSETAADDETLEVLCENNIRFTVLSPAQAVSIKMEGARKMEPVRAETLDTSAPYRWYSRIQPGKFIDIFFYSRELDLAISKNGFLSRPEELCGLIETLFRHDSRKPRLLTFASDGENYGHHYKNGHQNLARVLRGTQSKKIADTVNFAQFLELAGTPEYAVEIVSPSAWSCPHGVARWTDDCGCSTAGNTRWNQKWRKPLRAALNSLAEKLDSAYEKETVFADPWKARDDYALCQTEDRLNGLRAFLKAHALSGRPDELKKGLKALEMQKNRMLMFTSCGWFFDDISGLEAVQILKYAARATQLAGAAGPELEKELAAELKNCPSNLKRFQNGETVYRELVKPSEITLERAAAQHCASAAFGLKIPFGGVSVLHGKLLDEDLGSVLLHAYRIHVENTAALESGHYHVFILKRDGHKYAPDGFDCFVKAEDTKEEYAQTLASVSKTPHKARELLANSGYRETENAVSGETLRANPLFGNKTPSETDRLLQNWTERLCKNPALSGELLNNALALETAGLKRPEIPFSDNLLRQCAESYALALESFSAARLEELKPWLEYFSDGAPRWKFHLVLKGFLNGFEPSAANKEFSTCFAHTLTILELRKCL